MAEIRANEEDILGRIERAFPILNDGKVRLSNAYHIQLQMQQLISIHHDFLFEHEL